jgi:GNAT superfamily N-acetyltransferase
LFLSKFYILKEHRSKDIFSLGLDFMRGLCSEQQLDTIYLTVNRNNTHACEVYLHKGFKIAEKVVTDIGCGFVMDDYIMEYDI